MTAITAAAAIVLGLFGWGEPKVLSDTNVTFHSAPGVWFMFLRADCDHERGMEVEITDPTGKTLCPLHVGNWGATQVKNRCDCLAYSIGRRSINGDGSSFVSASAWKPKRGLYRIRVKGLLTCRVTVSAGASFSNTAHWVPADTLTIKPDEGYEWTASWGEVVRGDSTRVKLVRLTP